METVKLDLQKVHYKEIKEGSEGEIDELFQSINENVLDQITHMNEAGN